MKDEKFEFTADMIGSEILERFSTDIYTQKSILRELVKNASDSFFELLAHIENYGIRMDGDTLEHVVDVDVNSSAGTIMVSDKGIGLDKPGIEKLLSIALTDKRDVDNVAGHRGIGFWSAYTAGDELIVTTSKIGSSRSFTLTLYTKTMRELQGPGTSIAKIMNNPNCIRLQSSRADSSSHYTKILISIGSKESRLADLVNNHDLLEKILLEGCCVGFSKNSANVKDIMEFYNSHNLKLCKLRLNGNEISKHIPDNIGSIQIKSIHIQVGKEEQIAAWMWYSTHNDNAVIDSNISGIRLFCDGFPLGSPNLYSSKKMIDTMVKVSRPDLLDWHIGEIHLIHEDLKTNADGESIRDSVTFKLFKEKLRAFYVNLIIISQSKNITKKTLRDYDKFIGDLSGFLAKNALSEPDKQILFAISQEIENHNKQVRGKLKSDIKESSKSFIYRKDVVKTRRRAVSGLISKAEKQFGIDLKASTKTKNKSKTKKSSTSTEPDTTTNIDTGADVFSKSLVIATIDELRDAICEVLSEEPSYKEDILTLIDESLVRIQQ